MKFYKYQALSNDFVIADNVEKEENLSGIARLFCDRKKGVGADGLILGSPDFKSMRIFNSDGSEAKMCGNGVRCFALHVLRRTGMFPASVMTAAGEIKLRLERRQPFCCAANLGKPVFSEYDVADNHGKKILAATVNTGTPHVVMFDCEALVAESVWERLKESCNVDCVRLKAKNEMEIVTFERGAGRTAACGTGAAAAFVAAKWFGLADGRCVVNSDGGSTDVFEKDGDVWISGEAHFVYDGNFRLGND